MAREPANYFVVGARQSGKSSLVKAIQRGYARNPEVEGQYLSLAEGSVWERFALSGGLPAGASRAVVIETLRKTEPGRRRLFLIDEADLFIAEQMVRGYETLHQFRSLSEEGKCFFVLAGFWKLYEAAAFDYQSPIKNFGETLEVGPLEELTELLRTMGCRVPPDAVKRSLARLDLAFIFKATQGRYACPVPLFRKLVVGQDPEACLREELNPKSEANSNVPIG